MDLATLRSQVRELVEEKDTANLTDAVLNDLIERATQRIEADYTDDYGATPRQMMATASGTITSTGFALPSDFLRARAVRIGNATIRYASPEMLAATSEQEDSTVDIVYYARLPKLVNDTDTNWLLDIASRVYVYATVIEYTMWNVETEIDKNSYASVYTEAKDQTGRSNSPRSAGGWQRNKGHHQGHYTVIGENMVFGDLY